MPLKYLRKAYTSFATHIYDVPARMLAFLLLIIFFLLPLTGLDLGILGDLQYASIIAILAVSWDLLVGRTGQINMGQALFYGAGAYGAALLYQHFGWPVWMAIPISLLISAGIAVLVGLPCLRLKGPYLALVTMSIPLAVGGLLLLFMKMFGGDIGIRLPLTGFFPTSLVGYLGHYYADYFLALSLLAISAIIIYKIANSGTGVVFVSLLDDELASKACGINVTRYKLMSFIISGVIGSLAGCVQVYFDTRATPAYFNISISLLPIIATFIGGIGTIYGAVVGAYIYQILNTVVYQKLYPLFGIPLQYSQEVSVLIFMSIIIILVVRWPRGIARTIVDKLEDLQEPREIEETEKEKVKRFSRWRNALHFSHGVEQKK